MLTPEEENMTFRSTLKQVTLGTCVVTAAISVLTVAAAAADFYAEKTIKLIVGNSPGGDYDTAARLMVRHMPSHIPGRPGFIVQNMKGASTVIATNYLYTKAPKDGLVMGSFSRNIPSQAFLKKKKNLKKGRKVRK